MCRCIGHDPVPLNYEQRFEFAMPTYTRAAMQPLWSALDLWNQWVKWSWCGQASSQPAPEWTKTNQTQPTNQPKKKAITKQPNKQPINGPSSKFRNQLFKQNKATNAPGINIRLVCHVRIKQSVINTIK